MSFPRYPAYKPSGVEWLGEVPEHWNALPLRRLISEVSSGTSVNAIDEPASIGQAGVLKTSCVYTGKFRPEENKAILESELERATCPVVAGSLVVSRMNTPDLVGAAGLVKYDDPFLFLPDRLWQVTFQDCDPQFMNYWCKSASYRSQVQLACSGTSSSMQNLSQDNFYSFIAPLASKSEQLAIASFLDRETTKIDVLVAEQQRLIELLQEKKWAVISHAVTKGLNPNAPMKDSGVEWLGEVPEHWDVKRIKHTARMESGHTPDRKVEAYWVDCDIPWVSLNDTGFLKENDYISETTYSINELGMQNSSARLLPERVVVFSRDATIGRCAITTRPMAVSQHFIAWVCGQEILPEYLLLRLKSMTHELERLTFGATLKTIGMPDVKTLATPVPPMSEQEEIVEYVTQVVSTLEEMSMKTQKAVELLQERRAALISAAVTGQIDVRGLVETEAGEE